METSKLDFRTAIFFCSWSGFRDWAGRMSIKIVPRLRRLGAKLEGGFETGWLFFKPGRMENGGDICFPTLVMMGL
jgi:hypothetical protein